MCLSRCLYFRESAFRGSTVFQINAEKGLSIDVSIHPFIGSPFKKPKTRVGSPVLQEHRTQLQPQGKKLKKGYERTQELYMYK